MGKRQHLSEPRILRSLERTRHHFGKSVYNSWALGARCLVGAVVTNSHLGWEVIELTSVSRSNFYVYEEGTVGFPASRCLQCREQALGDKYEVGENRMSERGMCSSKYVVRPLQIFVTALHQVSEYRQHSEGSATI